MFFFLYGEDDYNSNEKLQKIKEKFLRDVDVSGYNIVVLDEKITIEKLAKELSQSGFLSPKKLVIIKNLLQQPIAKDLSAFVIEYLERENNKKDDENIIVFFENSLPHSNKGPLSGEKLKIFKKLESLKYSQESKKMPDAKLLQWIVDKFKENGKAIDNKLADLIIAKAGNNLWTLDGEIKKVSNYNKEEKISKQSIDELISSTLNDDIFLFCEKLADKKTKEALSLLRQQINSGANIQYLLSMMIRQFRILLQIKSAIEEKVAINNLPSYLSIHPYVVKKSLQSAQLYSLDELKIIYKKLLLLDKNTKFSKLSPEIVMSLFVMGI